MNSSLRVRLNVTSEGTLMALSDRGAVIHLPFPQAADRQTTLTIEGAGQPAVHIPARVIRTVPFLPSAGSVEHHVVVQFLPLSVEALAVLRGLASAHDRASNRAPIETLRWNAAHRTA